MQLRLQFSPLIKALHEIGNEVDNTASQLVGQPVSRLGSEMMAIVFFDLTRPRGCVK